MIARSRPRATYEDVLAAPTGPRLEVFKLVTQEKTKRARKPSTWNLLGVWRDDAHVRAEPFDAIELDLALIWQK